jgi:tRNA modification GTPase
VDEVLVTVFRAPRSYTGEDSVEISCHASPYIENRIVQLLLEAGCRAAGPGEFTVRAFLAGKLDLAQAEAVADLIASSGRAQHSLAMGQLRGGVSSALAELREELTELAALLELELDFSEEDVEFASRERLRELAARITVELDALAGSFALGNAIREGVPVAIVGAPNAGKSTLLNALAGDDRAMVSDIAGTTRDRIEERVVIDGVDFRLIDTAGLRDTDDVLEQMGIDRALEAVSKALIVLLVVDRSSVSADDIADQIAELNLRAGQRICVVANKIDVDDNYQLSIVNYPLIALSAKSGENLNALREWLSGAVDTSALEAGAAVISGARHYEALMRAGEAIGRVSAGLSSGVSAEGWPEGFSAGVSVDLLAEDLREALHQIGTITGTVTSDDILGTIFSKFCIGK